MSTTEGTGTQACASCGAQFPAWSMFCTQCGAQTVDSRPGSTAPSAMAAGLATQRLGPRPPASASNRHGTWAIVWTVCAYVLCFLCWFPAFSQAKQSRMRGEPIGSTATSIVQVGLVIWILLQVVGVLAVFWLAGQGALDPTGNTVPPLQP